MVNFISPPSGVFCTHTQTRRPHTTLLVLYTRIRMGFYWTHYSADTRKVDGVRADCVWDAHFMLISPEKDDIKLTVCSSACCVRALGLCACVPRVGVVLFWGGG